LRALTFGPDGLLYVLNGAINAVQVFDLQTGQQVRTIGTPGGTRVGPWDPTRLTEPVAMTIDASNKLWIVDSSFQPKRISRWSLDGKFEKDFMGPTHYSGGGFVDPGDHSVVNHLGMKFRMDFTNKTWRMESIVHGYMTRGMFMPDRPMYFKGHRYLIRADGLPLYDMKALEGVPELTGRCLVNTNGETFVMGHKFLDRTGKLVWSYPDPYMSVQSSSNDTAVMSKPGAWRPPFRGRHSAAVHPPARRPFVAMLEPWYPIQMAYAQSHATTGRTIPTS
jgi:hypothetical protein